MNTTFRIISDKSRYIVAALLVAFSVFVPMLASAAQVTERSIALSSATKSATAVTYGLEFTAPTAGAGVIVVDFCSNSPLIGQACTPPAGMSATTATVSTSGYSKASSTASKVVINKTVATTAGEVVTAGIAGVTNPSATGTVYARILTYTNTAAADEYVDGDTIGTPVDTGSVAFAITDSIAISGDVLESLSFCVSGAAIAANCVVSVNPEDAPTLKLGEDLGNGIVALSPTEVSVGNIYTQITTNASGGAIVSLKSSASDCGGLVRAGADDNEEGCGIAPALIADVFADADAGQALFGVKTSTATDGTNGEGAYVPVGSYNNSTYLMNYVDENVSGVTSTYGDQFLTTSGAPAINKNMMLTFGASAANNTPAGSYSADLSLIATGKF